MDLNIDKEDQKFEHWPESDILTHWKAKTFEFNEILKSNYKVTHHVV